MKRTGLQKRAIPDARRLSVPDDPVKFRERIGNLRELVNELREQAEDVTSRLESVGLFGLPSNFPISMSELDFYSEVRRFEIFLIKNALRRTRGSQVKAARLLKLSETTLNSKLKNFKIDHRDYSTVIESRSS